MKPETAAMLLKNRGSDGFSAFRLFVTDAPDTLTISKLEAFLANPAKNPLTDAQVEYLSAYLDNMLKRVPVYGADADGFKEVKGYTVKRVPGHKAGPAVCLGVRADHLADPRIQQHMTRQYLVGQGAVGGPLIAAKNDPRKPNATADARKAAIRKAEEDAKAAAKPKAPVSVMKRMVHVMGINGQQS